MAKRMLQLAPGKGLEAYRDQCGRTIPHFWEGWKLFCDFLIYHAENGTKRTVRGGGPYYGTVQRYAPPQARILIFIAGSYILTPDKVLLLGFTVDQKTIRRPKTPPDNYEPESLQPSPTST